MSGDIDVATRDSPREEARARKAARGRPREEGRARKAMKRIVGAADRPAGTLSRPATPGARQNAVSRFRRDPATRVDTFIDKIVATARRT